MYKEDSISSHKTGGMPRGTATALSVADEVAEVTLVSLHRLQSAFVELALNETLRDERSNAAACLQRAQAMLHGTSPQPSENGGRQGLAPWQVRRVLAHIEANLGTPIRNKDLAALARLSTFHFRQASEKWNSGSWRGDDEGISQSPYGEVEISFRAVAHEVQRYLDANVAVDRYLADQILLPLALGSGGHFTTLPLSTHTQTNIAVIQKFLPLDYEVHELAAGRWSFSLRSRSGALTS